MSDKIKIGVMGCANIAKRFLIPAINNHNSFELCGIASRSSDKAISFADNFQTKAYYDYESLVESNLDAVYIPLPNGLHYKWIKEALNNNLHVLVEKSLACDFKQVIELNKLAQNKNLVLLENFQFRFHEQLRFIHEKINDGSIGQIQLVRSSFGFPPFDDKDNIRYQKKLGGGALLDAGAYTLKIAQIFLGNDIYVDSASLVNTRDHEVDISGSGFIKQKNGLSTAQIAFGFNNFYQNSLEIWGTRGRLFADRIFTAGPGIEPRVIIETNNGAEISTTLQDDHFANLLDHFCKLTNEEVKNPIEYIDNINQGRLIKEFYEKSQN
jgi:predicted dehydrogenase